MTMTHAPPPRGRGAGHGTSGAARAAAALVFLVLAACAGPDEPAPGPGGEEPAPPPAAEDPPDAGGDAGHEPRPGAGDDRPPAGEDPGTDDPSDAPAMSEPIRGAWVHLFDDALKSAAGVAEVAETLADAGASAVFAQVTRRHDAYYDSEVLPATPDPAVEPGFDVLAELTSAAAERDLEVHAWISVAPTEHHAYDDLPAPDGWVASDHGRDAPEADRWVSRTADGAWSDYLDPALPEVRAHTAAIAAEIAERYDVDGVHLDYVRYAGPDHGYHPDALARYREETGAAGTPDPDDEDWQAWRQEQTTQLVAEAAEAVADADPGVAVSAAVIAWGAGPGSSEAPTFADTRTASEALQPWPDWVADGLVDAVAPMLYFRDHEPGQAAWFDQWTGYVEETAHAHDTLVAPGVAGYLNTTNAAEAQVRAAMSAGNGALVYSYQQPTDDGGDLFGRLGEEGWGGD